MYKVTAQGFGDEARVHLTPSGEKVVVRFNIESFDDDVIFFFDAQNPSFDDFNFKIYNSILPKNQRTRVAKHNASPEDVITALHEIQVNTDAETVSLLCDEAAQFAAEFIDSQSKDEYDTVQGGFEESFSFDVKLTKLLEKLGCAQEA